MDFNKLSKLNVNKNDINVSHLYEVDEGGFGVENKGIRTYFCSARVATLKDDIETFEKLTSDKSWPVSQIIQRDLDKQRIKKIASQYILRDRNIKYFPPIIIVILPRDNERGIAPNFTLREELTHDERELIFKKSKFSGDQEARDLFLNAPNRSLIDGFYVLDILPSFRYKLLCWNKQKYYAVVIDGQHRLESLKEASNKDVDVNNYMQDVVFVDLSDRVKDENVAPVEAVRRIFIDINYTAVPVTNARKCLMDDKDLASLFVQALVNDDDPNNERNRKFLLPQLVDWHTENLKHQLPHITGVLVLYQIMSDVVLRKKNLISIDDLRNKSKVRSWVSRLQGRFLVDDKIKYLVEYSDIEPLSKAIERYEEDVAKEKDDDDDDNLESVLFEYDYYILEVAQKVFMEVYCKSIVRFFTELYHYDKAIKLLKNENAFNSEYQLSRILVTNSKKFNGNQGDIYEKVESKLKNELEPKFYLLFTVLGQKTLFEIFFRKIDASIGNDVSENAVDEVATQFLSVYNNILKIVENSPNAYALFGDKGHSDSIPTKIQKDYGIVNYGIQASSFWQDIIYKDSSIIYNSQGIQSLQGVLNYIENFFDLNDFLYTDNLKYPSIDDFRKISHASRRISIRLKKEMNLINDSLNETTTNNILDAKREFLNQYLVEALKIWSENS